MEQKSILIIEDDPITVRNIQEMLKLRGYRLAGTVGDGLKAIEMAEQERPDLILMDVVLQGDLDGIDAAMRIQSRLDIPVVFLTASTDDTNLKRAQKTDPYGYLIKPLKKYDLYSAIETALTRHRMEKKIKESEAFSSSLLNSSPVPVIVVNLDASIRYVNRAFEVLTGFEAGEVVGLSPPYPWQPEAIAGAVAGPASGMLNKNEEHFQKKNGDLFTVQAAAVPVSRDGELLYYLESWEDITLRRYLEEQVLDISERERIRIGRDLHDGIGQELTAVGYLFGVLAKKIRGGELPGERETEAVMGQLDQAKNHVRLLAKGLSPVNFELNGIAIALDELCRSAERIYGIRCAVDCDDITIRDNSKATHIYFIIQESLNNAVKHGKSKNIKIMLKRRGQGLFFSVVDDGVGLPEVDANREGLGMMFMKYRADIIGGALNVNRRKPSGTIVTCLVKSID
jgi:two-component system, LuxR family, sensor kinase FixL